MRVILADDHEIMREGLCALLRRRSDVEVVGQASDGRSAVEMARKEKPDLVIIDIGMPNLNGVDATRLILSENPKTKIMALSTHSDISIVAKAMKAGACGYILKESAFDELATAVETIIKGKTYLCSKIANAVFSDYVSNLSNPKLTNGKLLTGREREVLQLVSEGKTTKEIASELHVSVKTVDSHREHIMNKLGIHSIAELTKYAIREGITFI